jgi:L-alanine-DL-glutamate epimerase-like enolase superfamily enzyme
VSKLTDVRSISAALYLIPIRTRMPLKFGPEVTTEVTCARAMVKVVDRRGRRAEGWGETPLSVQWVWPSSIPYRERQDALIDFTRLLVPLWANPDWSRGGHPLEFGRAFLEFVLPRVLQSYNACKREGREPLPWLAALVCASAFDIALHDAYGILHNVPTYETYTADWMNQDLGAMLTPAEDSRVSFQGRFPARYLVKTRPNRLVAWHLVGALDPLEPADLTGDEPQDGEPVLLRDWIQRDGLRCLKIKLKGDDPEWDLDRIKRVGRIAIEHGVNWLSADFNCTVRDPAYVCEILDRLMHQEPRIYGMLLYVEQPFPYDLHKHRIDVRPVAARKPLFLDESAHDWQLIRLGRSLGWSGVALKTCKSQTGALLSLCWARAHGMTLMVQDLTNPMLAQIPHVALAAHAATIQGVETNACQYYPNASLPEAAVHPGLYVRRNGMIDLSSIQGPGLGYRIQEIERDLPLPAGVAAIVVR